MLERAYQLQINKERLSKRVLYYLSSHKRGRHVVGAFIEELSQLGEVAIIGGMLRDLTLFGNREFSSDVDLVIQPTNLREFDVLMGSLDAKINRFGGYSTVAGRWKVDIWPLERTWARVAGHRIVNRFDDLLDCTFFNWDAVLFHVNRKELIAKEHYFADLRERVLSINLEPNPNPLGNAVRALRFSARANARWTQPLANHVLGCISEYGFEYIKEKEKESFDDLRIQNMNFENVMLRLENFVSAGVDGQFSVRKQEKELEQLRLL